MLLIKSIETSLWNQAVEKLIVAGWRMAYQYDGMDAGIDYNCYILELNNDQIAFEWTNWDEGEIRCMPNRLTEIEQLVGQTFKNIEVIDSLQPGAPRNCNRGQ